MKAITVRPPWSAAIILSSKDVENRSRNIAGAYRGPLVIHAGKRWDSQASAAIFSITRHWWLSAEQGAAIGTVDLVDVHTSTDIGCNGCVSPWGMPGLVHLRLANPRPFPGPIPYKGALGLWNFPDELLPEGWLS